MFQQTRLLAFDISAMARIFGIEIDNSHISSSTRDLQHVTVDPRLPQGGMCKQDQSLHTNSGFGLAH
jgi:hypothetical protein